MISTRHYGNLARLNRGFTLVELLVTMAIAAILLAIAVPSINRLLDTIAIRSACSSFADSLSLARAEGIRRSAGTSNLVFVAKKCTGTSFSDGWAIFQGGIGTSDRCYGTSDTLLQNIAAPSRGATITFGPDPSSANVQYVGFNGQGLTRSTTGAFVAGTYTCGISGSAAPIVTVVINALGRVRQSSQ